MVTRKYHTKYKSASFKVDTGAQINVLPVKMFQELFPATHKLTEPTVKLTAYGGADIPNLGNCILFMRKNKQNIPI